MIHTFLGIKPLPIIYENASFTYRDGWITVNTDYLFVNVVVASVDAFDPSNAGFLCTVSPMNPNAKYAFCCVADPSINYIHSIEIVELGFYTTGGQLRFAIPYAGVDLPCCAVEGFGVYILYWRVEERRFLKVKGYRVDYSEKPPKPLPVCDYYYQFTPSLPLPVYNGGAWFVVANGIDSADRFMVYAPLTFVSNDIVVESLVENMARLNLAPPNPRGVL